MKKSVIIALSFVMTVAMSVTALADVVSNECQQHESESVEVCAQGKGTCRHATCGCKFYQRAVGGAGKCVCGHWDYVHN